MCDCDAHRGPQTLKSLAIPETLHSDLRVRWKVAGDLRFRVAISEAETPSFCRTSGDLALSTRKSLAIAIVRFWCTKNMALVGMVLLLCLRAFSYPPWISTGPKLPSEDSL